MSGIFVNDNGTLRKIRKVFVNDNGTLREIQSAFVNDNGTLREFFRNIVLDAGLGGTISASDGSGGPFDTNVGIRFNPDGTVERGTSTQGNPINWIAHGQWIDPLEAASGNFSVRYTNLVSAGGHDFTFKAAPENSFVAISAIRTWIWNETSQIVVNNDFDCNFEVRDDTGSAETASVPYTFRIENSF